MAHGNTRLARLLVWFAAYVNVALLCMMCSLITAGSGRFWAAMLMLAVDAAIGYYAFRQGLLFELRQERIWKAVCQGLGGSFLSTRAGIRANPFWVFGGPLIRPHEERAYPKLRDVQGTATSWTGTVIPFAGQTVEEYTKHAQAFALAFRVPFVTFGLTDDGMIGIRAGQVPVPDAYHYAEQVTVSHATRVVAPRSIVPTTEAHQRAPLATERALLQAVPMAQDLQGHTWHTPIEGQHILIAARTGGGKGSWIWSLILALAAAYRAGLVRFWGCDPKRLELAIGRDWFDHYADNDADIVAMLEECVQEMLARTSQLQGKARKFTPSPETPLNVIVVDELGYLSALLPDKKLRERAEKAIATILVLGRAVGYSVVGVVQDPRKETINSRDLFPIRIAGGLPESMVDLVLDKGSHDAGALCEQIPLGAAGAGVAYVISETDLKPLCVRAAWCDDTVIQEALRDVSSRKAAIAATEECSTTQQDDSEHLLYQQGYQGE